MKICDYYRDIASIRLNESIVALVPPTIIIGGNLSFFKNHEIMLFTLPFFFYSFISFHLYLLRIKQSFIIRRKMEKTERNPCNASLFQSSSLLVMFLDVGTSQLQFYFPNGHMAGMIQKKRRMGFPFLGAPNEYTFTNQTGKIIGFYKVNRNNRIKIEVYDREYNFIGSYEKKRKSSEILDAEGRFVGKLISSNAFMDERIINRDNEQSVRLRRGWMPLHWSEFFPEANTPVLSFSENLSKQEKLLQMSFLINEFFVER
ncbi:hypothetical protein [Neobacillus thermocopriae]|uniref:Uncharacterized protein n=1 Tax=Neobacillus thermocopriae TaxID=1215031 RepID=A0A6B3TQM9_9BACI|nr:hypothetical protein [Neobacillus thermocopriae]MED3625448.1 hypothetical protein [Neobacillus thermocopriae]MED3714635.1 hypothetical protein [Neobacillus thermocopriae]NEX78922.1 hypothetical protein [Neobacillus thermocopriae]